MEPKFVTVYTGNGTLQAETVRIFLESMGIVAFVAQESAGTTFGFTIGPLGEARVMVPSDQAEKALVLLEGMEDGEFEAASDEIVGMDMGDEDDEVEDPDQDEDGEP